MEARDTGSMAHDLHGSDQKNKRDTISLLIDGTEHKRTATLEMNGQHGKTRRCCFDKFEHKDFN